MSADKLNLHVKTCKELGKPEVFEQLFDAYSSKIHRYLYLHLSSKEDAEDALSTTFVRLWEYVAGNPKTPIKSISALLYRIAHNLVIDQYRARKPAVSVEVMLEAGIELPEIKALDMNKQAEVSLVLKAFDKLEREDRDLLVLRFVEDMPVTDIAEIHSITENNASVRIHRALAKLREIVTQPNK